MKKIKNKIVNKDSKNISKKVYIICNILGIVLCIFGLSILILKGLSDENINHLENLKEKFYLIPIGFSFIFLGIIAIFIKLIIYSKITKDKINVLYKISCFLFIVSLLFTLLIYSNGNRISIITTLGTVIGILLLIFFGIKLKSLNKK